MKQLLETLLDPEPVSRFRKATLDQPDLCYEDYLGLKPVDTDADGSTNSADGQSTDGDLTDPQSKSTLISGSHATASGEINTVAHDQHNRVFRPPRYDTLRTNPFFDVIPDTGAYFAHQFPKELTVTAEELDWSTAHFLTTTNPTFTTVEPSTTIEVSSNDRISFLRSVHTRPAIRVEKLSELCIKAVAEACIKVTEETALLGGARPDIPWIQVIPSIRYTKIEN